MLASIINAAGYIWNLYWTVSFMNVVWPIHQPLRRGLHPGGRWRGRAIFSHRAHPVGSPLLTAYVVDFALAYLLGIAFQYFAIVPMRQLGPWQELKEAIKADTLSLVAFELGMFGWMALPRLVFFQTPPEPTTAVYWFMMQIAMVVGFLTSYPMNWWLVQRGFKEAM